MAGIKGKFSAGDLKKLQEKMKKLTQQDRNTFIAGCAKEIGARLLAKVKKRTPVGKYSNSVNFTTKDGKQVSFTAKTGRTGGNLRRNWTVGEIMKIGSVYKVEIVNPVEYSSYVEHGHRTADHMGWVQGRFMLTISEQEVLKLTPQLLEARLEQYLRGIMG